MTQNVVEPDAEEFDAAPAEPTKPKNKQPTKSRAATLMALIALAASGTAVYEYRLAGKLNDELGQANARNAQLQLQLDNQAQELKSVSAKLQDMARKNLPVSVIFRASPSGNGLMTFFKNNAPSPVEIAVLLSNPATERRREANLNIPANGLQSIGEADGWVFAPGHHIQITHAEFGTVEYIVPEKP
jgi:hypothetical protein